MGEVLVHARHPRVDLVSQEALAAVMYMLSPLFHASLSGLRVRDVIVAGEPNEVSHALHGVLNTPRYISEHLMRPHDHEHVGETLNGQA